MQDSFSINKKEKKIVEAAQKLERKNNLIKMNVKLIWNRWAAEMEEAERLLTIEQQKKKISIWLTLLFLKPVKKWLT